MLNLTFDIKYIIKNILLSHMNRQEYINIEAALNILSLILQNIKFAFIISIFLIKITDSQYIHDDINSYYNFHC